MCDIEIGNYENKDQECQSLGSFKEPKDCSKWQKILLLILTAFLVGMLIISLGVVSSLYMDSKDQAKTQTERGNVVSTEKTATTSRIPTSTLRTDSRTSTTSVATKAIKIEPTATETPIVYGHFVPRQVQDSTKGANIAWDDHPPETWTSHHIGLISNGTEVVVGVHAIYRISLSLYLNGDISTTTVVSIKVNSSIVRPLTVIRGSSSTHGFILELLAEDRLSVSLDHPSILSLELNPPRVSLDITYYAPKI